MSVFERQYRSADDSPVHRIERDNADLDEDFVALGLRNRHLLYFGMICANDFDRLHRLWNHSEGCNCASGSLPAM